MASLESRAFNLFLKLIRKKSFLKKQFDFGKFDFYTSPVPPKGVYEACTVERSESAGRNVFTLFPKGNPTGKHILYLHGGAYVQNFVKQHWSFLATLVESLQCTIIAPDYPLAPRHTYRDSFDMVVPLYQELVNAVPPRDLIVMGDSAGGGFALALIQYLSTQTIPLPSQLFLFSPWLDITLKNPAILEIDSRDPFLGIDGLKRAGKAYAGSAPPELYLLSPINGPMNMLPEVYLFVGSNDIMVADARKLKRILTEKNVPIQYREYEDMIHVWMFLNFPESKKARSEIIEFIRDR